MTAASVSRLHQHRHADYDEARRQIYQAIGDFSKERFFGRQVLVAVYVPPERTARGAHVTTKFQEEYIYQGKAVLVLKCGPEAFTGEPEYLKAMYGPEGPPKLGDWLLMKPNDGLQTSMLCPGGARVKCKDFEDKDIDMFDWDGWPCRVVPDECFIGWMSVPHGIV